MNGVSITQSRIEPNPTDMRLHRLVLSIENRMVQGSLYADNRGTESAGRLQTYARARLNSVMQEGDQFAIGFFTNPSPFKNLMYGEWSYTALMGSSGTQLTTSAGVTTSDAAANLFGLQTAGDVKRVSLRLSHPFIRSRNLSLWANLGLDVRNLRGEQFGVTVYDERLRLLSGSLSLRQDAWNGTNNLYTEITGGLGGLGASDIGDALLSRIDAHPQFLKAELLVSRYQNIGQMFGLYVALAGQISADPLPASEEFAVGGAEFGRAYDYWAISGDHGVSGQVELRHGKDPGLPLIQFYQLYGYYDVGWVWNRNAAAGFRERSLESAGVGLRLTLPGVAVSDLRVDLAAIANAIDAARLRVAELLLDIGEFLRRSAAALSAPVRSQTAHSACAKFRLAAPVHKFHTQWNLTPSLDVRFHGTGHSGILT